MRLLERSACCLRNSRLSRCNISTIPVAGDDCNKAGLTLKFAQAFLSFSSSITKSAPLQATSKPKAPVPAKRSKQRKPGKSKTVSKRLLQLPPIIRTVLGGSVFRFLAGLFIFCHHNNNFHPIHCQIFLKRCFHLLQAYCLYLLSPNIHRI